MTTTESGHDLRRRRQPRSGPRTGAGAFTTFAESTREDWAIIASHFAETQAMASANIVRPAGDARHATTAASPSPAWSTACRRRRRAERANRDDEYVLCALIHDIGDTLAPFNHPSIAAGILKPFVSEANHWMVEHHGIFQGYYFWHHLDGDRNARDLYADSPHYDHCEEFCALYDQTAFDPTYRSNDLDHYRPLLAQFFDPK